MERLKFSLEADEVLMQRAAQILEQSAPEREAEPSDVEHLLSKEPQEQQDQLFSLMSGIELVLLHFVSDHEH